MNTLRQKKKPPPEDPGFRALESDGRSGDRIGRVAFRANGVVGEPAFAQWHEACRPVFEVEAGGGLPRFQAAFEFFELDGLVFNRTSYSAADYHRTPRHVRAGEQDFFALQLFLQGRERGESEAGQFMMAPDRIVLRDWTRAYDSAAEATKQLAVIIPRDRIEGRDRLRRLEPAASWDLNSPQGMFLANAMWSVWKALPHATQKDAPAMASGFLGLLNGLLPPQASPIEATEVRRASFATMKDYLASRLGDPNLGLEDLTRAFHCSRAVIYRLFRASGGVRAFVQEQRLVKSFRELTDPGQAKRPIWQVAIAMGFRDPAYFHRAFKRRFGLTAGEAATRHRDCPAPLARLSAHQEVEPGIAMLHGWLGSATQEVPHPGPGCNGSPSSGAQASH